MDNRQYADEHGFFFASNDDQLRWAKEQKDFIPLADVLSKMGETCDGYMFVPAFYANFTRKDQLPVWVWRRMNWPFRGIQVGDIVSVDVSIGPQSGDVLAKVADIRPERGRVEVVLLTTNTCLWVEKQKVRLLNQD